MLGTQAGSAIGRPVAVESQLAGHGEAIWRFAQKLQTTAMGLVSKRTMLTFKLSHERTLGG
jgi:hypothetical protein